MVALVVGVAIGAAVAGGDDDSPGSRTSRDQTTRAQRPADDEPASPQPSSVEPNVGDSALEIGEPRVGSAITTTVLDVEDDYRPAGYVPPEDGFRWLGVNAKTCITGDLGGQPLQLSWDQFEAGTTNGATYPASGSSWDDFPSPQFPAYASIRSGCRQGWLLIPVPDGEPVNVVRLAPPGDEVAAEWTW